MLSRTDALRAATVLLRRMGEVAIAAAVLRAQQAQASRRYEVAADWYRIAEAALSRLAPTPLKKSTVPIPVEILAHRLTEHRRRHDVVGLL